MSRKQKRPGAETAALFMGLLNLIARSEGIQPNMQTIRGLLTLLDTGGNHHAQQNESMFSDHFENKEKADA